MSSSTPTDSLVSTHPSTSGLQIALHPLALLTISDYITRHHLRNGKGPIIGVLLGHQSGRDIAIEHAYEVVTLLDESSKPKIEDTWFQRKLDLFKETHPTQDLIGWFTTTPSPGFVPSPDHVEIHQQLLDHNESLIMLLLNHSPSASIGGKLPLAIYESVYEADETEAKTLQVKFVPLKYTIETGEAEMIGMDMVAKSAVTAAEVEAPKQEEQPIAPSSGKGKEKESVKDEDLDKKLDVGTQNDELLANLTAKRNAVNMLNSRIRLLLKYLESPPPGPVNQQILREIKSLTHSRLPLLKPANVAAFDTEKAAEEADVNLVVLLGTLTKSIEEVRSVGRKFSNIENMARASGKVRIEEGFEGMMGNRERRRLHDSKGYGAF